MKIKGNTVLITGGATGIGFALAESFLQHGNEVIICGRREDRLLEAKARLPELQIRVCDISKVEERESLCEWVTSNFPLNILVNNAGIRRLIDFKSGPRAYSEGESEIETNLVAPVHLSSLFIPFLSEKDAAIVNISSSLAFKPMAHIPLYCATKAAIHAFSVALREQLRETPIKVFEIIPPLVDTELDKGSRGQRKPLTGISPAALAAAVIEAVSNDEYEIVVGEAIKSISEAQARLEQIARHYKDPGAYR